MMDRFLEVRERWDPDRIFLNEFLEERIFQLPPLGDAPVRRLPVDRNRDETEGEQAGRARWRQVAPPSA